MKIVYLLTTADASAGTENAVFTQANAMSGHADVEILSIHRTAPRPHFPLARRVRLRHIADKPKQRQPSRVIAKSWDSQFDAQTDDDVERALRAMRADIVVTTTPALAYLAARYVPSTVRIVHQEHRVSSLRGEGFEPLRLAVPRLSAIVTLTDATAEWLRAELAGQPTPIIVLPNSIDVAGALVSDRQQPLIVTAGRLVPTKQFEHVVRAFGRANEEVPGWQLRIYGDGRSRGSVQRTIRRLGLETQVLLPGVTSDLATVMAKASIVALASATEAFSLVIAEAQAAAVPVVSYDTHAGPRDILEKTGGGLIVPMNSESDLAAGLRRLMTDQHLRDEYGLRGREGSWQFDVSRVTQRWLEVFREVSAQVVYNVTNRSTKR